MKPKSKSPKKGEKKKKGEAATPRASRREKQFLLEVGKTYEARDPRFRAIIESLDKKHAYPYRGRWLGKHPGNHLNVRGPSMPGWLKSGATMSDNEIYDTDLVREVKGK